MIIDLTKEVVTSIISIKSVTDWVCKVNGVPNISANKLPAAKYPAVAIYEIRNDPAGFADDEEQESLLSFQISMFSTDGSHTKVQNVIDEKMKELGFVRGIEVPLLFDTDNNNTQRVLLYSQIIEHSIFE